MFLWTTLTYISLVFFIFPPWEASSFYRGRRTGKKEADEVGYGIKVKDIGTLLHCGWESKLVQPHYGELYEGSSEN